MLGLPRSAAVRNQSVSTAHLLGARGSDRTAPHGWNRRGSRRVRTGMRTVIWAGLVSLTVAGCAAAPAATAGPGVAASTVAVGRTATEPTLVGVDWQLTSYRESGAAAPVPVRLDSTLSFTAKGTWFAHACNYLGGAAALAPATMAVRYGGSTDIYCSGESGEVERQVGATMSAGTVRWSIRDRVLTLTGPAGHMLTYRVRPTPYPDLDARTVVAGNRAGGSWRLAVDRTGGRLGLVFEERTEPGAAWGSAGIVAPEPADCLASYVIEAGVLGGEHFVTAWATPRVGKVTVRARPASAEQTLPFLAVPGSRLRIAGGWLDDFRPSTSVVMFYDRAGAVITAYPKGPCRPFR